MNCPIEGVIIRPIERSEDERGWLLELYRQDEIPDSSRPLMSYLSMTRPGVARGPHEHRQQSDLFCFVGPGEFRLYLWDNRRESDSFGQRVTLETGDNQPLMVVVPPGVVHAYVNIGAVDSLVFNAPNTLYQGAGRTDPTDEIRHEDDPDSPFKID